MNEKLTDALRWYPDALKALDNIARDLRYRIANDAKNACLQRNQAIVDKNTVYEAMKNYLKPGFYDPHADSLSPRGD